MWPSVTGHVSLLEREGRRVPGHTLLGGLHRKPESQRTLIAAQPLKLHPLSEVLLGPVILALVFEVTWPSSLSKLFSFGFPKTYYCLPQRFCVYMVVVFFPSADCQEIANLIS